jgi:ATP-dependent phosphofructokinase / diphosphate-dependent phosphofructokinase
MFMSASLVFIMEVMGRHAGWLCAAGDAIDTFRESRLCLFPEIQFSKNHFLKKVDEIVKETGFCVVVASEGIKDEQTGDFVSRTEEKDVFGHYKLGNAGIQIGNMISSELGYKTHVSIPDYLQRASAHHRSTRDQIVAEMVGAAAVRFAFEGKSGILPMIYRKDYHIEIRSVPVENVANREKTLPLFYIKDRYNITKEAQSYLLFWMN